MLFTENQRQWSIKIISDLYKWNLTTYFRPKISPNLEANKDYFEKIKKPIDLDTVKATLYDGQYKNVNDFVSDLKLVFENAINYYGEDNLFTMMAREILIWIKEQEKDMNISEDEKWLKDLAVLQGKLENHLKNKPANFSQSLIPPR